MKLPALLFAFFLTIGLFAQEPKLSDNFDVQIGEMYDETDGRFKSFHNYENKVIAINSQKSDLVVQIFDPVTLKETKRIVHEKFLKDKQKSGFKKGIKRVGDNLIFFFSKWNRKEQIESLEAQIFSLETLKFGEQKEIIRQQGKIAGGHRGYSFSTSFDENKMMVHYRLKPKHKKDTKSTDIISINVFDDNLNELWKSQVTMPFTERKMDNEDFTIDDEGNFYMLAKIYEDDTTDEKKKKEKNANYHLELFKVKKNTDAIVRNKISIGDKFIDEVILYEDAKGDLVIAGTSKNPDLRKGIILSSETKGSATGVFTVKLADNGSVDSFKSYDFPLEMLNKNASKREKKKNKKKEKDEEEEPAFAGLKINSIVANNDGSFIILGEQRYVEVTTSYHNGKTRTTTRYYYRDILAAKIEADGSLAWMHKLPKYQRGSRGKGTMSYTHLFAGDKHFLVYLDNVKNLNLPDDEFPHKHTDRMGGYFTAYIIDDKTGDVQKEAIFNTRDVKGEHLEHFDTDKILSISSSEILIEGFEGRSKDFLVKVTAKSKKTDEQISK